MTETIKKKPPSLPSDKLSPGLRKRKRRPPPLDPAFDLLLDDSEREDGIEVIREWESTRDCQRDESHAGTIAKLLVAPLWRWIEANRTEAPGRRSDLEAALALAVCAEDIGNRFRNHQAIYPERVNLLESLWLDFQRQAGLGAIAVDSTRRRRLSVPNKRNAQQLRNKEVIPAKLEEIRDKHLQEQAHTQGWRKVARAETGLGYEAIKKRISS